VPVLVDFCVLILKKIPTVYNSQSADWWRGIFNETVSRDHQVSGWEVYQLYNKCRGIHHQLSLTHTAPLSHHFGHLHTQTGGGIFKQAVFRIRIDYMQIRIWIRIQHLRGMQIRMRMRIRL
jgi:hypothetical protein